MSTLSSHRSNHPCRTLRRGSSLFPHRTSCMSLTSQGCAAPSSATRTAASLDCSLAGASTSAVRASPHRQAEAPSPSSPSAPRNVLQLAQDKARRLNELYKAVLVDSPPRL